MTRFGRTSSSHIFAACPRLISWLSSQATLRHSFCYPQHLLAWRASPPSSGSRARASFMRSPHAAALASCCSATISVRPSRETLVALMLMLSPSTSRFHGRPFNLARFPQSIRQSRRRTLGIPDIELRDWCRIWCRLHLLSGRQIRSQGQQHRGRHRAHRGRYNSVELLWRCPVHCRSYRCWIWPWYHGNLLPVCSANLDSPPIQTTVIPIWLAECAMPKSRGRMMAMQLSNLIVGLVIANW